ncbi:Initiator Replication protein [Lachnospiraceae bacterium KHCPX20]|nr:Initiator Replication protein [Lachnospiraceae bacterium KHCPX20]
MDKDRQNNEIELNQMMVRKGNRLINAKYSASLLEEQLISIGTAKLPRDGSSYEVTIYPSQIKRLIPAQNDKNIYSRLKRAASNMTTGYGIFIEDGKGNFSAFPLVKEVRYENGEFKIFFNDALKDKELIGLLKDNYTSYSLLNIVNFRSEYSLRIYELIRQEKFKISKEHPRIIRDFDLDELKCTIGIVNTQEEKVHNFIQNRDWKRAVEAAKEKKYSLWGNFERSVLRVARDEIKEKCDVFFDYSTITSGRGGKVIGVKFIIQKNDLAKSRKELNEELYRNVSAEIGDDYSAQMSIDDYISGLPSSLLEYDGHNGLTQKDLEVLYDESNMDAGAVVKAILAADEASKATVIKNYVGWIRSCIKNGYDELIMVANGTKEQGERIKEAKKIIESRTEEEEKTRLADIWKKNKTRNSKIYQDFIRYLDKEKGLPLRVVEMTYVEYELGAMLIDYVRDGECELPIG